MDVNSNLRAATELLLSSSTALLTHCDAVAPHNNVAFSPATKVDENESAAALIVRSISSAAPSAAANAAGPPTEDELEGTRLREAFAQSRANVAKQLQRVEARCSLARRKRERAPAASHSLVDQYLDALGGAAGAAAPAAVAASRSARSVAAIADEVASAFAAVEEMSDALHERTAALEETRAALAAALARAEAAEAKLRSTTAALAERCASRGRAGAGPARVRSRASGGAGTLGSVRAMLPTDAFEVEVQRATRTRGKRFRITAKFGDHTTLIFADVGSLERWFGGAEDVVPPPRDVAAERKAKESAAAKSEGAEEECAGSSNALPPVESLEVTEADADGDVWVLYRAGDNDTLKMIADDLALRYAITTITAEDLKEANSHYKGLRLTASLAAGTRINVPEQWICAAARYGSVDGLVVWLAKRAAERVAAVARRDAALDAATQRAEGAVRERQLVWGRAQKEALGRVAERAQVVREAEAAAARVAKAAARAREEKREAARRAKLAKTAAEVAAKAAAKVAAAGAPPASGASHGRLIVEEDEVFDGVATAIFRTDADDTLRTISDMLTAVYSITVSMEQLLAANVERVPPSALSGWTRIPLGTRVVVPEEHVQRSRFGSSVALGAWLAEQAAAVEATQRSGRAERFGRLVTGRWRMRGTEKGQPDFTYEMELAVTRDGLSVVGYWLDGAQKLRGSVEEATQILTFEQLGEDGVVIANTCVCRLKLEPSGSPRAGRPHLVEGKWTDGEAGNGGDFTAVRVTGKVRRSTMEEARPEEVAVVGQPAAKRSRSRRTPLFACRKSGCTQLFQSDEEMQEHLRSCTM